MELTSRESKNKPIRGGEEKKNTTRSGSDSIICCSALVTKKAIRTETRERDDVTLVLIASFLRVVIKLQVQ